MCVLHSGALGHWRFLYYKHLNVMLPPSLALEHTHHLQDGKTAVLHDTVTLGDASQAMGREHRVCMGGEEGRAEARHKIQQDTAVGAVNLQSKAEGWRERGSKCRG